MRRSLFCFCCLLLGACASALDSPEIMPELLVRYEEDLSPYDNARAGEARPATARAQRVAIQTTTVKTAPRVKEKESKDETPSSSSDLDVLRERNREQIRALTVRGRKQMDAGLYAEAVATFANILRLDPDHRRARRSMRQAQALDSRRKAVNDRVTHEIEFDKRVREVEHASIPYVQPRQIQTTITQTPYSQEIREKEEAPEIAALREELQDVFVDLDFRNADLREVIRYLAEMSDINIVIDETALLETARTPQTPAVAPTPAPTPAATPAAPTPLPPANGTPAANQRSEDLPGNPPSPARSSAPLPTPATPHSSGSAYDHSQGGVDTYRAPEPPSVSSPRVTIYLKQIPLLTALDIILRTKGLRYKIERDFIWISTEAHLAQEDLVTRIYTIQHAIGEFASFEAEPLNLDILNTGGGSDLSSQFFNQSSSSTSSSSYSSSSQPRTEAQAAEDLIGTLKKIVPQPNGASMTLYQRTGKLIVRNTPGNLRILEGLLRNLDVSSMQVSIEVRLVEISSLDGIDIGTLLEWGKAKGGIEKSVTVNNPKQGFGRLLASAESEGMAIAYHKLTSDLLNASLQALVAKNRATILSAPKLTCLNNQTANIKIVKNTNYIAKTTTNRETTDGVTSTDISQTIGKIPEGIVLEITPNVSADQRTIRLTVHPQVTEMLELQSIETEDTVTQLPSVTQRSLDTTVSIRNGGTMVLGGLMKGSERENEKGTPGLMKVPVLRHLFKTHNKIKERNNLIIFITARILNADGDEMTVEIVTK